MLKTMLLYIFPLSPPKYEAQQLKGVPLIPAVLHSFFSIIGNNRLFNLTLIEPYFRETMWIYDGRYFPPVRH